MSRLAVIVAGVALAACSSNAAAPSRPSPSLGIAQDRAVPAVPLVNEQGKTVTLASFRGKTVLLAPFLTLCQEVCPLTTENLLEVQRAIDAAGLHHKVVIVEYSVDPERDTPARLAAYAKLTGASWPMLTGTQADITAMDKFFYVYAERVAEGSPPQTDWWTHQPLTYDVDHSDGYFVIDPQGRERFATSAMPDVASRTLPKALNRMLDDTGQVNLHDPTGQLWTVPEALQVVGWVAKQDIPMAG